MFTRIALACSLILSLAGAAIAGDYYNHGNFPSPGSPATSASMRAELDLIAAGFSKLPTFAGNANKVVIINGGATGLTTTAGQLSLAGNFTVTGAFNTTFVQQASTTLTLPAVSGTLATLDGVEIFTNKTLITPSITAPSGLTKADVGLGNVDNTSDSFIATGTVTPANHADRAARAVDVKDEGAVGDGVTDARQAFVDTDADTVGPITCSAGTYVINSNMTITSPVLFMDGCILKPASGVVITLTGGAIAAPTQTLFDTTVAATSYVKILNNTVSPMWYGVTMIAGTDDLASWNQVVKHINAGHINHVQFPPGTMELSAEPATITQGAWAIHGAGGEATKLVMRAGAGTAGQFFTLGDATQQVGRSVIHDFSIYYLNYASLDGTRPAFNFVNVTHSRLYDIYAGRAGAGNGIGGFIRLGSNALATTSDANYLDRLSILLRGASEGTVFDIERANGLRVSRTLVGTLASVTGAARGIYVHPTGGTTTTDSHIWSAVEFNFPGDNVNTILDLDASQGIIVNQWFTDCVFDHGVAANIKLHIDAGAHASARMNNIYFTTARSYADGGGAVLIDNTGQRDIGNLSFNGGVLTGYNLAAIRTVGSTAQIDLMVRGVNFSDTEVTTSKAAIDAQGISNLVVTGNSVAAQFTSQNAKYSYLVNFTGDATNFVISGNDCRRCQFGVIESTNLGLTNPEKRIASNNNGPSLEYTQRLTTTDATPATIMNIALLDARVCHIQVAGSGVKSDGTDRASYEILGTFYRTGGGNVVQQGATTVLHSIESNAAWNFAFVLAGTTVQVKSTGVAATTIKWGANVTKFRCLKE